jgi:hypothetical protein
MLVQLRITARMCIAALRAARAPRRCGAPLRHMAPRPGWAQGHVTYVRNVMCHCAIVPMLYNMMLEVAKRVSTVKLELDGLDGYGLEDLSNELRRVAALLTGKSTTRPAFDKIAKVHSSTMSRLIFFWIKYLHIYQIPLDESLPGTGGSRGTGAAFFGALHRVPVFSLWSFLVHSVPPQYTNARHRLLPCESRIIRAICSR